LTRFPYWAAVCGLVAACGVDAGAADLTLVQTAAQAVPATVGTRNPFADATLYVDPEAPAAREARALRTTRPADAAQLDKIASTAQADWIGGWTDEATLRARTQKIRAAGALPLYVFYNIPGRDCGQFSAGGAESERAYAAWIDAMARALQGGPAVVVLEPDAVAQVDCLPAAGRASRFAMLKGAIATLSASGAAVYLDAAHSSWHPAAEMATRLGAAGIAGARGFSLNVSNYNTTERELAFGRDLGARLDKPFVVDTSRNGRGPQGSEWCNPSGRALGERPTTETGEPRADALLWIKRPGESDGTCNGGPPAGQWWPEYALGLAQRAAYR
jgi:endoglucanase